ncbi:hypothetical protein [Bradyrhizobium sp. sGM-13]|uniref:hypothetical protein n=1 Tax=Bradyrhizobium sp. sGM-13 TaxID=2831781 RepID=UPI001BCBAB02|nr:hypothetical protein [Bradyrhizobium sp. sGM-13]
MFGKIVVQKPGTKDALTDGQAEPDDEGTTPTTSQGLGSFDRITNQDKAWRFQHLWAFSAVDAEQDAADREDDDLAEESERSGIGAMTESTSRLAGATTSSR